MIFCGSVTGGCRVTSVSEIRSLTFSARAASSRSPPASSAANRPRTVVAGASRVETGTSSSPSWTAAVGPSLVWKLTSRIASAEAYSPEALNYHCYAPESVVSVTFDNLGEAAQLELGMWPAEVPEGQHFTVVEVLPRLL